MGVIILLVFLLMFKLFVIFYVNIGIIASFYIFLLFTNMFCLLNPQKIAKKRKSDTSSICGLISYFGMKESIFVFMFFTPMCRIASMFNYVWYVIIIKME